MIQWKKFDTSNPPEVDKEYLVYYRNGSFKVAQFEIWQNEDEGAYVWVEYQECTQVYGVTHYAEIQPPTEVHQ
jgi:hypothetical protein